MRFNPLPTLILLLIGSILICQGASAQYGIIGGPTKSSYVGREIVNVSAIVPESSMISLQIEDPAGNMIFIDTVQTVMTNVADIGDVHVAIFVFRLPDPALVGRYLYSISAVADEGDNKAVISGSMQVAITPIDASSEFIPALPIPIIGGTLLVVASFRNALGKRP
jgi:hypothetical protein